MDELLKQLTPEVYQSLRRAIELGKWPDGRVLTEQQKELCMEAIIRYDAMHYSEQQRVGYIDRGKKAGESCDSPVDEAPLDQDQPIRWKH